MTHRSRKGAPGSERVKKLNHKAKNTSKKLHHPHGAGGVRRASISSSEGEQQTGTALDLSLLAIMQDGLKDTLEAEDLNERLQEVKGHLYNKAWLELFRDGNEKLLKAYAARWAPSRAMAFREMMRKSRAVRAVFDTQRGGKGFRGEGPEEQREILALGGGAGSEVLATAALVQEFACSYQDMVDEPEPESQESQTVDDELAQATTSLSINASSSRPSFNHTSLDIGSWDPILSSLTPSIRSEWPLLTSTKLSTSFTQTDLLTSPLPSLQPPTLITLLFTLTELLAQSRTKTIALLTSLTKLAPVGSLFLVADSASDLASFPMGSEGREWPVWMVLHAILHNTESWQLEEESDSTWWRLKEDVKVGSGYPCKLENVRYWMRVYRRV